VRKGEGGGGESCPTPFGKAKTDLFLKNWEDIAARQGEEGSK